MIICGSEWHLVFRIVKKVASPPTWTFFALPYLGLCAVRLISYIQPRRRLLSRFHFGGCRQHALATLQAWRMSSFSSQIMVRLNIDCDAYPVMPLPHYPRNCHRLIFHSPRIPSNGSEQLGNLASKFNMTSIPP